MSEGTYIVVARKAYCSNMNWGVVKRSTSKSILKIYGLLSYLMIIAR